MISSCPIIIMISLLYNSKGTGMVEVKRERTEIAILGLPDSSTKHFKNPNSTPTVLASLPNWSIIPWTTFSHSGIWIAKSLKANDSWVETALEPVGAFGDVKAVKAAMRESLSGGSCSRGNWAKSYVIYHQPSFRLISRCRAVEKEEMRTYFSSKSLSWEQPPFERRIIIAQQFMTSLPCLFLFISPFTLLSRESRC